MKAARLASTSKQQARSKQATKPSRRPLAGPTATGVPKSKKKATALSGMAIRNFCTLYVLADRIPTGRKPQNMGVFRPLLTRAALGTWRNPRCGPKTEKRSFPALGALLRGNPDTPNISARKCTNLLTFCVLADRTPPRWEIKKCHHIVTEK